MIWYFWFVRRNSFRIENAILKQVFYVRVVNVKTFCWVRDCHRALTSGWPQALISWKLYPGPLIGQMDHLWTEMTHCKSQECHHIMWSASYPHLMGQKWSPRVRHWSITAAIWALSSRSETVCSRLVSLLQSEDQGYHWQLQSLVAIIRTNATHRFKGL